MKKICELIGTGDLFAEIAKIKTFSAFSGMDTKDLTAFFVCQQGDRCCTDSVSAMTLEQVAKLIVYTRGEIIDNLTTYHGKFSDTYHGKFSDNLNKSGSAVTVHTQTNSGTNDSLQKVVPNNLTEMKEKSLIAVTNTGTIEDRTETTEKISSDDKMGIFTNDLICDIFATIAEAISIHIYVD